MSPYTLLDPLVRVGYTALTGIAAAFPGPTGGPALAAAIVLLTLALRAGLLPVAVAAQRAGRARAALAPELDRLRRRYGRDRARLAAELTAAYRRAGVSPLAGIRPALVQLAALTTMYRIIVVRAVAGQPNAILHATLLGAPLAQHWPAVLAAAAGPGPAVLFAAVLAALLAVAWGSSRVTARLAAADGAGQPPALARLVRLLPYGTVGFAALAPVAVSGYLLASTACTLAERLLLSRLT
jgi:YidC/Oxa1 family membrane protein insertase